MEQTSYDVVIFDLESSKIDGLKLLKKIRQADSGSSPIGITNNDALNSNAAAMSEGIYAIMLAPFDMLELQIQVKKAIEHTSLVKEVAYLRHARPNVIYNFDNIISNSDKIREIFSVLRKIAETDTPVIIYGEPGTGKELIAGAIHYNSQRRDKNFIKVNCAALPENLLESELFGHEAGATPQATKQRIGRFEQANHGTLFLKEISSLSLEIQSKLLQFINDKKIKRLGATQTIKLDVRLVLATEQNLQEETRAGRFKDDLYWPLNVVPIDIPPLRHRTCDIPELADYFLKYFSKELNRNITGFEATVKKKMLEYHWPGNVRELRNIVERAVMRAGRETISLDDMAFPFASAQESTGLFLQLNGLTLYEVEKNAILKALESTNWVQKDAAKLLGISKRALNYKIENFKIKNPKWIKNK
jgi:DNA-binding NtrC family response regulator